MCKIWAELVLISLRYDRTKFYFVFLKDFDQKIIKSREQQVIYWSKFDWIVVAIRASPVFPLSHTVLLFYAKTIDL